MMRLIIFLTILASLLLSFPSQAQKKAKIKAFSGQVTDSMNQKAIAFATVRLMKLSDSSMITGTITDTLGAFNLTRLEVEPCYSIISCIGYRQKVVLVDYNKRNVNLGIIRLSPVSKALSEVIITGTASYMMNADRSVFRPDSASLSKSSTSLDLIAQVPELKVNKSSKSISIVGKSTLVLLNGVIQGADFDASTIHPNDIEKIEVINDPSSQYSSEYEGVINIVLKKELTKGTTLFVSQDYLHQKRSGSLVNLQLANKKFRFYADGMLFHWSIPNELEMDRTQVSGNNTYTYHSHSFTNDKSEWTGIGKVGLDYYPSKKSYLNAVAQISTNARNEKTLLNASQQANGIPRYDIASLQHTKGNFLFQNYALFYKKEMDSLGRQVYSGLNYYVMHSDYHTDFSDTNLLTTSLNERSQGDKGYKQSLHYHLNYVHPFSATSRLETGLQAYYQRFRDDIFQNESSVNLFEYSEFKPLVHLDYYTYLKKTGINIGLRYEQYHRNMSDSLFQKSVILPTIRLSRKLNKHFLNASYYRTAYYPSIWHLTPEVIMVDSFTYNSGNPFLAPQLNNHFNLNWRYRFSGQYISTTLYHMQSDDVIQSIYVATGDVLLRMPANTSHRRVYGIKTTGSFVLWEDLEIQPYVNFLYDSYEYEKQLNDLFAYKFDLTIDYYLPYDLLIGMDMNYQSKNLLPQGYEEYNFQIGSVYIQKRIFKNRGSIMLSYQDMFNSITDTYIDDGLYRQQSHSLTSSSGIFLRFSYWFTKGREIKAKSRQEYMEQDVK